MSEFSEDISECLRRSAGEERSRGSTLRGFRYAFALSFGIWAAGGALVISGCASTAPTATFTSSAHVASAVYAGGKKRCGDIPLPPAQFDHVPAIPTFVSYVPYGQVGMVCRQHGVRGPAVFVDRGNNAAALLSEVSDGGFEMKACSWKDVANLGFVVMPEPSSGDISSAWEACALRHEYGHINGWAANHPDAHYEDD